jgi:expansin (peptidoglycan-binding protein)
MLWACDPSAVSQAGNAGQPGVGQGGNVATDASQGGGHSAGPGAGGQLAASGGSAQAVGNGGATAVPSTDGQTYGTTHSGQYHLGPVDFAETDWHNACAPSGGYVASLRDPTGLSGEYLAGVSNQFADGGGVCDACILIKTGTGRQIVARVVTYGDTNEPGDIDVSPSVYEKLNSGEYPRAMSWQFAKCPDTGTLRYEFQTGANVWWTSLWVRNPKVPLTKVEVKSTNHKTYVALARASDGTFTDASGFGEGSFTFRLTALDGQTLEDTLPSFTPGQIVVSPKQFE